MQPALQALDNCSGPCLSLPRVADEEARARSTLWTLEEPAFPRARCVCHVGIPIVRCLRTWVTRGTKWDGQSQEVLSWGLEAIIRLFFSVLCQDHLMEFSFIRPAVSRVNEAAGS